MFLFARKLIDQLEKKTRFNYEFVHDFYRQLKYGPDYIQNKPLANEINKTLPFKDARFSIHFSRIRWVMMLPMAHRILDLGGTCQENPAGALVVMGYPYTFSELIINDLPLENRHELYSNKGVLYENDIQYRSGKIKYRYHSMEDLSIYEDNYFDLVNSGESIEHITEEQGRQFLSEAFRVLKPGGTICVDTPNGLATRLQQPDFIDPDHKVEYLPDQLEEAIKDAGFHILEKKGLNWLPNSFRTGVFDLGELTKNFGVFDDLDRCYIQCFKAVKPDSMKRMSMRKR